jgi:hypothetical protein
MVQELTKLREDVILKPFLIVMPCMPGKRKQVRTAWKADRKVQLAGNRRQKAIRLTKAKKSAA